ncbi:MAG: hypothetical protein ABSF83_01890 [Nitrososphaerales archaeon]
MNATSQGQKAVVGLLERVTKLRFLPFRPGPDSHFDEEPVWCVVCDEADERAPYVWRCWEDREGDVWLETPQFADALEGIERRANGAYVEEAREFDYAGFARKEVQERFVEQFGTQPGGVALYRNYEQYVSARNGVDLHLRFDGAVGLLLLSYGIRVGKRGGGVPVSEDGLRKAVSAMDFLHWQIDFEEGNDE